MKKFNIIELLEKHNITDIAIDSRQVVPGSAFFALGGLSSDGNDYINQAFASGAAIVISDKICNEASKIFKVEDSKQQLAEACRWLYKNIPEYLIAVTGTSGKTSVVNYILQILEYLKVPAASIGSLGIITNNCVLSKENDKEAQDLNTQDLVTFYKTLARLKASGVNIVAFEASSHGLDQGRIHGVKVNAAGFTSFSQDHLDYHGTMEAYLQAKLKIFKENLADHGIAVINCDMHCASEVVNFLKNNKKKFVTVGEQGDVKIISTKMSLSSQHIEFEYRLKRYSFSTDVIGAFQASNILIAAVLASYSGQDFDKIIEVLPQLKTVNGRLEKVVAYKNIFVDHSHKPEALEKALNNLATLKEEGSKLIVVFGCGGNRDRLKRPIMGKIASEIADITIITDDNPRFEEADFIRREILAGTNESLINEGKVVEVGDRKKAISYAISLMGDNDILLIAGKGHETYQIIKDQKIPFSDIEVVKEIIEGK
ncbi:MAG: murE [Rickettsiaceae bacterium]|jgi:UDP-N-acetylmuramoyl-L-alanyl-D-glutamate--2,6-diaminopimelate ligase|nr:murE [Rickettsiaceae bacterium]